jgi:isopenicillin N synthase-like dioxygenase
MSVFKTMAVRDVAEATKAIPVIDVGPAFRGDPSGRQGVAAQIRRASEHVGFFYIAGHGVPAEVVDAAFAASREFHAMPLDDKRALRLNENNIGYLAVNESMQRASTVHKATRPNYNESFFISHDRGADHPDVVAGTPLRGRNQWPEAHDAMRAAMVRYFKTLEGVGERLLPVMARALEMPDDYFAPMFAGEAHINLRFLHYPHQESDDSRAVRAGTTHGQFLFHDARA